MIVGVQVYSSILLLTQSLRLNEVIADDDAQEDAMVGGLLSFVKDFLCLMIAPGTVAGDYTRFVYETLADAGYTNFPLSALVDMLHTRLSRSLQESIPIDIDRVRQLRYIGLFSNDRIALEVSYV